MKSLPETISRRNPIDVTPTMDTKKEWLCMKPCPNCRSRLKTDGQYFWCLKCDYDIRPEIVKTVSPYHIRWKKEEDRWLIDNWETATTEELMKNLHRSLPTCRQRVYKLRRDGFKIGDRIHGRKKKGAKHGTRR